MLGEEIKDAFLPTSVFIKIRRSRHKIPLAPGGFAPFTKHSRML